MHRSRPRRLRGRRAPAITAAAIALRSAHTESGYDAFSTLTPVNSLTAHLHRGADVKLRVRRVRACACGERCGLELARHAISRFATSCSMMPSSSVSNVVRTRAAVSVTSVVRQRVTGDAGGVIRDARDADHARAHVRRDDDLGHRRHPGRLRAELLQHLNLCRRLVRRARHRDVDALGEVDLLPSRRRRARARGAPAHTRASCRGTACRVDHRSDRAARDRAACRCDRGSASACPAASSARGRRRRS